MHAQQDTTGTVATAEPAETSSFGAGRVLAYQPALDGLRAVAVIAVLLFHGGFGWMSGGYLGVSVFFTLSGYLITSLLAAEHERTGDIRLGRFVSRRVRRLLPASCVCLLSIVVANAFGAFDQVANLRRDVIGAALQVGNWTQLTGGSSYADLFRTGTSPVAHYWSLAIEEQFYLVWPLTFVALARWARSSTRLRRTVVALAILSATFPVVTHVFWSSDAVYFATQARAAELLIGAALALILRRTALVRAAAILRWLAVVAISIVVVEFVVTPAGHGWVYEGLLPLFAVVSAALIVGLQVDGPVRRVLALHPLVALGRVSYGVYLFHWPLFVVLDQGKGLGAIRFFLGCAVTLILAVASSVLIEQRIRRARSLGLRDAGWAVLITAAVVVIAAVVATGPAPEFGVVDADRAAAVAIQPVPSTIVVTSTSGMPDVLPDVVPAQSSSTLESSITLESAAATDITAIDPNPASGGQGAPAKVPAAPARIMIVGDSTASLLGKALTDWAYDTPGVAQIAPFGFGGCGFVPQGLLGTVVDLQRVECTRRIDIEIPQAIAELQPDVVVVSINVADSWDRSFDKGRTYVDPSDPYYASLIADGYRRFFDATISAGVSRVVWLDPPLVPVMDTHTGEMEDLVSAGRRRALIDDAVAAAVAAHPGRVVVVPYGAWLSGSGLLDDVANRPDGVHLSDSAARSAVDDYLGAAIVDVVRGGSDSK